METKIIRSKRRKKTVSARVVEGQFVVQAPANMSDAELQPIIENLQRRWQKKNRPNQAWTIRLYIAGRKS